MFIRGLALLQLSQGPKVAATHVWSHMAADVHTHTCGKNTDTQITNTNSFSGLHFIGERFEVLTEALLIVVLGCDQ